MRKGNALSDVSLEAFNSLLQETLLLLGDALERVNGLLGTVRLLSLLVYGDIIDNYLNCSSRINVLRVE